MACYIVAGVALLPVVAQIVLNTVHRLALQAFWHRVLIFGGWVDVQQCMIQHILSKLAAMDGNVHIQRV